MELNCNLNIPTKIRFWTNDSDYVDIDIVEGEMRIEDITQNLDPEITNLQRNSALSAALMNWFSTDYKVSITPSQAWIIFLNIRAAYEQFKKKLEDGLTSHSGTMGSALGNSQTPTSKNSTGKSLESRQNENSSSDQSKDT